MLEARAAMPKDEERRELVELKVKGGEVSPRPLCLALEERVPDGLQTAVEQFQDEFEFEHGSPFLIYRFTDLSIDRLNCGI